mmetsp:Transcript_541/g.1694  ORF Transcript_541/g.1694 Transcript_541/m.1694 type:complete len:243 (+) Transcript_541:1313-2041(+)
MLRPERLVHPVVLDVHLEEERLAIGHGPHVALSLQRRDRLGQRGPRLVKTLRGDVDLGGELQRQAHHLLVVAFQREGALDDLGGLGLLAVGQVQAHQALHGPELPVHVAAFFGQLELLLGVLDGLLHLVVLQPDLDEQVDRILDLAPVAQLPCEADRVLDRVDGLGEAAALHVRPDGHLVRLDLAHGVAGLLGDRHRGLGRLDGQVDLEPGGHQDDRDLPLRGRLGPLATSGLREAACPLGQ